MEKIKKNKKTLISTAVFSFIAVFTLAISIFIFSNSKKANAPEIKNNAPPINSNSSDKKSDSTKIFFASNGKDSVYKLKKEDKWVVIWNGEESKGYDEVSNPLFNKTGAILVYSAELDGQNYVVVNNTQEIIAYDTSRYFTFSEDGTAIAFVSEKTDGTVVIINSEIISDGMPATSTETEIIYDLGTITDSDGENVAIILSPNGDQIIYVIENGDQVALVVDGEVSNSYDSITDLVLNDDGTVSYVAQDGDSIITVENNQVVSTANNSATDTADNSSSDTVSNNIAEDSTPDQSSYENYPYRISTDKDVVLDPDNVDYSDCSNTAGGCNF